MTDTTKIVLTGIINRLESQTAVTNLVGTRIYSNVPQQTTFPYIFVEMQSEPFKQDDDSNMSHTAKVYAFSRQSSPAEALDISFVVYNALDRQENNITISIGDLVNCDFIGDRRVVKDTDGVTWFCVSSYSLTVD